MSTWHKFIAAVIILAAVALDQVLHPPAFVMPLVVFVVAAASGWFVLRAQANRAEQRADLPVSDISLRLDAVVSKTNIRPEEIVWVQGPGRPYMHRRRKQLLISPSLVELLNDDELLAVVQEVWFVYPAGYWSEFARTPGPWLLLAGSVGAVFYDFAILLAVVGAVLTFYSIASDKITEKVAVRGGRALLAHGGAMVPFLGALSKIYTAVLDASPRNHARSAHVSHKLLCRVGDLVGLSESQVGDIVKAAGGAPDLLRPPAPAKFWQKQSPYRYLVSLLIWLAILMLAAIVAGWLTH